MQRSISYFRCLVRLVRAVALFAALAGLVQIAPPARAKVNVTTYHNDNARTGQNLKETLLTPDNVRFTRFGKLFAYPVDGYVYAQPLYLSNVTVPGKGRHNVVFLATEHDSVYAFDADDNTGANADPLWHVSFLNPNAGVTSIPNDEIGSWDIVPEIGITGTPVIDANSGTLYVVVKTREPGPLGSTLYPQRLHALDIHTGQEKPGSPVLITASVPGIGDGNDGQGNVPFYSKLENQRAALLLLNGVVYIAWGSHGDITPYHGWILGYDARTLQQVAIFNATPNGLTDPSGYPIGAGGIWQGGAGLAADDQGNMYFATGNGSFDAATGGIDYGDSIVRLRTLPGGSLAVADYFTPLNQDYLNRTDADLGSGGVLLLPDQPGPHPHLLVQAGKEGKIYIIDRDRMGQFHPNSDNIVQELGGVIGGVWGMPAYFNNTIYYWGIGDTLKAFQFLTIRTVNLYYDGHFFGGFGGAPNLTLNGSAFVDGFRLHLTDGRVNERGSCFANTPVAVTQFQTQFTFRLTEGTLPGGEGFTFTLQGADPHALGDGGGSLGYGGLGNSVAIKFDLNDTAGEGNNSIGLYLNGVPPTTPADSLDSTGLDLHSGHTFRVYMSYDGVTLQLRIRDLSTGAAATQSYAVDIPGTLGENIAYAGFTASTGTRTATQDILTWRYNAPSLTTTRFAQVSEAPLSFDYYPSTTPSISANGENNGIVWALQTDAYWYGGPSILHAYDAANLGRELYNSYQAFGGRDVPSGSAVKFSVPTIANGKVFVGTGNSLTVYGRLGLNRAAIDVSAGNIRRLNNGGYALDLTFTNSGNRRAEGLSLNTVHLGAAQPTSPSLPQALGMLLVGESQTITLTFPASAAPVRAPIPLSFSGSWNTAPDNRGDFQRMIWVMLP